MSRHSLIIVSAVPIAFYEFDCAPRSFWRLCSSTFRIEHVCEMSFEMKAMDSSALVTVWPKV